MTELVFLGTRGEIDARSRQHRLHSSLLLCHAEARIMIDCGADWLTRLKALSPTDIVLTHAHPDHAFGLAKGAPCPVYAPAATWASLSRFPILDRRTVPLRKSVIIGGPSFRAYGVEHSSRAPAVGYRIRTEECSLFYVPDVAAIGDIVRILRGIDCYIGDGATLRHPIIRRRNHHLIGHASIAAQLGWCKHAGVRHAIFTHCGSEIVKADPQNVKVLVRELGREHGIEAHLASDGERLVLSASHAR